MKRCSIWILSLCLSLSLWMKGIIATSANQQPPSSQPTCAPSSQPSFQPSTQPSGSPTKQPNSKPSGQPSTQPSRQPSSQPSRQPSGQPSRQPSSRPSRQPSGQPTSQPSRKPTTQPSSQPSKQPNARPTCQPTAQPSGQPTRQPSSQPTTQPSSQPSSQPSRQPTRQPTRQPSDQPVSHPSSQPTIHPTSQPSVFPTYQPSSLPSSIPTSLPTNPTTQPSGSPSSQPTQQPTHVPSGQPSSRPSIQPTTQPSMQPSSQPIMRPTSLPSTQPSSAPTSQPTLQPSSSPTNQPSIRPTCQPTAQPSDQPSSQPLSRPTAQPSLQPSAHPSYCPSTQPSGSPSSQPTSQPSGQPTTQPSSKPSNQPSSQPSVSPTSQPTIQPSTQPSIQPTCQPSRCPSTQPSRQPSTQPSWKPSRQPSSQPTKFPTSQPSRQPSIQPSTQPTTQPSRSPSAQPSRQPTSQPSSDPTIQPTVQPTCQPTSQPSFQPSHQPTAQPSSIPSSQPSLQPTSQPSSQPSSLPTVQPSTQPTAHPSSQPTAQPSIQPSIQPTLRPTDQPSTQPSRQPSTIPSAQPSASPSTQPTCQPTVVPSVQPTNQPSLQPSSQPTTQPSAQPSAQPLAFPSAQPSCFPTCQPSCQPSSVPSKSPSTQPTSSPTSQPSGVPSSQPSIQPTVQPSSVPSNQPTSQPTNPTSKPTGGPTEQPRCPPGEQYDFTESGSICVPCIAGQYSGSNSITCINCPAGSYSDPGASNCTLCAINYYSTQEGTAQCSYCGAGKVNGQAGTDTSASCIDPLVNFIIGSICLVMSLIAIVIYFIGGRIQKIAFERKFRLTNKVMELFGAVVQTVDLVTIACIELNQFVERSTQTSYFQMFVRLIFKPFFLFTLSAIIVPAITCAYILNALVKILFNAMVLWRAYYFLYQSSFVDNIESFLTLIDVDLLFDYQVFRTLAYPFLWLFNALKSININLKAVEVTCTGAQAPAYLLTDLIVFCMIVLIIESNFQLLWTTIVIPSMSKIRSMVFNRYYVARFPVSTVLLAWISLGVSVFPEPIKLMQYCLGFLQLYVFIADGGKAVSSTNCDGAIRTAGQTIPMDSILAYGATIFAYATVFPALYLFSEVLIASAKFRGVVESSSSDEDNEDEDEDETVREGLGTDDAMATMRSERRVNRIKRYRVITEGWCSYALRCVSTVLSLDWLFLKCVFVFGNRAFRLYHSFLTDPFPVTVQLPGKRYTSRKDAFTCGKSKKLMLIRQSARNVAPPYLPWFDATVTRLNSKAIEARSLEIAEWETIKNNVPTFKKLTDIVEDELSEIFPVLHPFFCWVLKWFPPLQWFTESGRTHWWRVVRSYVAICLAALGIWTELVFTELKLEEKFKEYKEITDRVYTYRFIGRIATAAALDDDDNADEQADAFTKLENDPKVQFSQFVSATITSRLAILQVVQYVTVWTTFAIDVSSCPIFVHPKSTMYEMLPPLIDWHAWKTAQSWLEQEAKSYGTSQKPSQLLVFFLGVCIFTRRSRLIEFVTKGFLNSVAVAITFYPQYLVYFAPTMFFILLLQGLLLATQVLVLLNRLLYPRDRQNDQDSDSDANDLNDEEDNVDGDSVIEEWESNPDRDNYNESSDGVPIQVTIDGVVSDGEEVHETETHEASFVDDTNMLFEEKVDNVSTMEIDLTVNDLVMNDFNRVVATESFQQDEYEAKLDMD